MGMFSWKCKGCGHELKTGEYVRMNGCVGEYDGYGRAGGFEYENEEPSCWHVRCYKAASTEQKLDDSPSKYAPNQGFGCACLENMKNYDPQAPTKYEVIFFVDHSDFKAGTSVRQEWYIVSDNKLSDKYVYEAAYEAANSEGGVTQSLWDSKPSDWFQTTAEDDRIAFYKEVERVVQDHIQMKNPMAMSLSFDSLEEAKNKAESLVHQLPNPEWGYELAIFGKQEKAQGLVYKFNRIPDFDRVPTGETYPHGGPVYDYPLNGKFTEEIAFVHGRPASSDVKSY